MSSPRALTLGGFVGVNRQAGGDFRVVERITGWGDAPAVMAGFEELTGQDGAWAPPGKFGQRTIAISGFVQQASHLGALAVRDELTAIHPRTVQDLVVDDGIELMSVVRVTRGVVLSWLNDVAFRYDIEVSALYPFKRALTPVTVAVAAGATVPFTANGTAPAAEIEVTTTSAGTVVLSSAGLTIRTGALPSGTVLTSGPGFTNPERTVVGPSGESLFSATLAPMQWPAVVPGANSFVNTGTADVDLKYFPTYP